MSSRSSSRGPARKCEGSAPAQRRKRVKLTVSSPEASPLTSPGAVLDGPVQEISEEDAAALDDALDALSNEGGGSLDSDWTMIEQANLPPAGPVSATAASAAVSEPQANFRVAVSAPAAEDLFSPTETGTLQTLIPAAATVAAAASEASAAPAPTGDGLVSASVPEVAVAVVGTHLETINPAVNVIPAQASTVPAATYSAAPPSQAIPPIPPVAAQQAVPAAAPSAAPTSLAAPQVAPGAASAPAAVVTPAPTAPDASVLPAQAAPGTQSAVIATTVTGPQGTPSAAPTSPAANTAAANATSAANGGAPGTVVTVTTADGVIATATLLQQALDRAAVAGLTNSRLNHASPNDIDRCIAIGAFEDAARNTHPFRNLPIDADWGQPTPFSDYSSTLCARGTSRAITLNVVGEISRLNLTGPVGQAIPRATLHILPLDPSVRAIAENQTVAYSNPADPGKANHLRHLGFTNRSRPIRVLGAQPDQRHDMDIRLGSTCKYPSQFTRIYDACERLRTKAAMATLAASALRMHDIVMMEVRIRRYRRPNAAGTQSNAGWTSWTAYHELMAINLLQSAPMTLSAAAPLADPADPGPNLDL
ncbi:hypothetical protein C8R43DRAFT_956874 [Mycena crocata]|nr:hypothetical protein C8R43DRAFT_956874 [Mycena crocata]